MSLLNAHTFIRGVKDTADNISQEKPIDIGSEIWMHETNMNKALAWILRTGKSSPIHNHIFGHLEDTPFAEWVTFAGTTESSQGVTGLVLGSGQGARVTLGSRIYWPRINEVIRLSAVMSTDTTGAVTRNYGRGVAATSLLKTGDRGLIITPAFEQGFTTGKALSNSMVYKSFATSEVSWPVSVTNIEGAERHRGGPPFPRALKKALKQSKNQMEAELLFAGKKVDDSFSPHPISVSQGMQNYISTNSCTATSLSRMDLWDILSEWVIHNKNGGAIFCSGQFKAMVTMWSMGMLQIDQSAKADGLDIEQVLSPFGRFDLVDIDLFGQEANLMGTVLFVPTGQVDYHPLIDNENLDIRYNPISRDEVHSKEGEIYGVYGWEFYEEEMFFKLDGLQFAA